MTTPTSNSQTRKTMCSGTSAERSLSDNSNGQTPPSWHADLSAWIIWAVLMLIAIAILPFAVRNQEVVKAIARMCGFNLE